MSKSQGVASYEYTDSWHYLSCIQYKPHGANEGIFFSLSCPIIGCAYIN